MLETDIPDDDRSPEQVFGQRMKRERTRRGWRQEDLAARLAARGIELHPSAIAKMEREPDPAKGIEPRMIRLNEAVAIGRILDCGVDQMLTDDDVGGNFSSLIAELAREQEITQATLRHAEVAYLEAQEADLRNRQAMLEEIVRLRALQASTPSAAASESPESKQRTDSTVAENLVMTRRRLEDVERQRARLKLELSKIEAARARGHREAQARHRAGGGR